MGLSWSRERHDAECAAEGTVKSPQSDAPASHSHTISSITTPLASVVHFMVDNGHVNVLDVGMLAQTCHEVNRACMDESVWKSLCLQKWPSLASFPVHARGYRWMYWHWCGPVAKRGPPIDRLRPPSFQEPAAKRRPPYNRLGPPSCTVDQMQLHVNVKYKDSTVLSKVYSGRELGRFLDDSGVVVQLKPSVSVGKAEWTCSDDDLTRYEIDAESDGLSVGCSGLDSDDIHVRVHLFRKTDSNLCCLIDSDRDKVLYFKPALIHPVHEEGGQVSRQAGFDLSKKQRGGFMVGPLHPFRREFRGVALRSSSAAIEIANRYPDSIEFALLAKLKVVHCGNLAFTSITILVHRPPKDSGDFLERFNSIEQEREHGVTLLHILSELQGMQFDEAS